MKGDKIPEQIYRKWQLITPEIKQNNCKREDTLKIKINDINTKLCQFLSSRGVMNFGDSFICDSCRGNSKMTEYTRNIFLPIFTR